MKCFVMLLLSLPWYLQAADDPAHWFVIARDAEGSPCMAVNLQILTYSEMAGVDVHSPFYPIVQSRDLVLANEPDQALLLYTVGKSRDKMAAKFKNIDVVVKEFRNETVTYDSAIGARDRYAVAFEVKSPDIDFPFLQASILVGDGYQIDTTTPINEFLMLLCGSFSGSFVHPEGIDHVQELLDSQNSFGGYLQINNQGKDRFIPVKSVQAGAVNLWVKCIKVAKMPTIVDCLSNNQIPDLVKKELVVIQSDNARIDARGIKVVKYSADVIDMSPQTQVLAYIPMVPPAILVTDGEFIGVKIKAIAGGVPDADLDRFRKLFNVDSVNRMMRSIVP